jgi:hypothetical protein
MDPHPGATGGAQHLRPDLQPAARPHEFVRHPIMLGFMKYHGAQYGAYRERVPMLFPTGVKRD